ncbi:MAG: indolepyruvate ferredoxin oxidoreductase family protein [Dermatophilaceae bacterium]
MSERNFRLADRYAATGGEILASGLQALVRLPLDQRRLDRAAGRRSAVFISGYEGSPLGGYDKELLRIRATLDEAGIVFRPAVNEELAANAVQGAQLVATLAGRRVEGVAGIWYGKAPGLDRATDALRHGNLGGASATGGVLALVGDDATAKSSTVPSSSELAMAELGLAVLSPADPADILHLGLHGIALSRFSGLWSGLKLATNVVDGSATFTLADPAITIVEPDREIDGRPFHHQVTARFLQPHLAALEESLAGARPELARRYARANGLNVVTGDARGRVGVVAAGLTFRDTQEALASLGVDPDHLSDSGIRLLKLGMVAPLDPEIVREFAAGLTDLIVVEEKRPVVETAVKAALYGRAGAPRVHGKTDPDGRALLRATGDLPPQVIADALAPVLASTLGLAGARAYANPQARETTALTRRALPLTPVPARTPYFCSGCPHNRSTRTPAGSLVAAGIGCHTLVVFMDEERVGNVVGFSQMGGEGAAWIGMSPFVTDEHLVQNLGDGTYHHSGSLAVRASVAAGTNVTYRILYNGAVAMTGGQDIVGGMTPANLARELLAEGVRQVVVTTDDVGRSRSAGLPDGVTVRHRDDLEDVLTELATVPGVTAVIHQQECATELRRKRKRGLIESPGRRIWINERVCEGCGDCGAKSNCLSVQPVETEFGRKTRIHQASCNLDYSCIEGDCPSFISVTPGGPQRPAGRAPAIEGIGLPDPVAAVTNSPLNIRIMGIGGTGIVTTAQVLAVAATNAGLHVRGLDQLGLSQKGGAVVSDLRLAAAPFEGTNKLEPGTCDVYLGADLLVAADPRNLAVTDPARTRAIVSTTPNPTGAMVADVTAPATDTIALVEVVRAHTGPDPWLLDARAVTEGLFGSDQLANTFLLGIAIQSAGIPVSPSAVEEALAQNGVAVTANLQAFRWGRRYAVDPAAVLAVAGPADAAAAARPSEAAQALVRRAGLADHPDLSPLITRLADDLIGYQDERYARTYLRHIAEVHRRADAVGGAAAAGLTSAFARNLHKLMAYKDEYEVARLSVDPAVAEGIRAQFGPDAAFAFRLHPPVLRALGMDSKIALGEKSIPALRGLAAMKRLRGTRLDPFGHSAVRRIERELPDEYVRAVAAATAHLSHDTLADVTRLAELPGQVRGYEAIKLANVERYRQDLAELVGRIAAKTPATARGEGGRMEQCS